MIAGSLQLVTEGGPVNIAAARKFWCVILKGMRENTDVVQRSTVDGDVLGMHVEELVSKVEQRLQVDTPR